MTGLLQRYGPWYVAHAPEADTTTTHIWAALIELSRLEEEEAQEKEPEWKEEEGERKMKRRER